MYCDSSSIAGSEIFAAVIDIFINGQFLFQLTLPGALLAHGYTDVYSKLCTLVWALWMVGGANIFEILEDIVAVVADQGSVERSLAQARNVIGAFCKHYRIPYSPSFAGHDHSLPYAIEVPDWLHIISNAIKSAFEQVHNWPSILYMIRNVLAVFKNEGFCDAMAAHLKSNGLEQWVWVLDKGAASFAKWRYETAVDVFDLRQRDDRRQT